MRFCGYGCCDLAMGRYIVGITGASGVQYAERLLTVLLGDGHDVRCVVSSSAERVLEIEANVAITGDLAKDDAAIRSWAKIKDNAKFKLYSKKDVAAPIASGSFHTDGMAVVPCSGGTLAKIANGISGGLVERAAEVCLKERRKLILVPRETPVSLTHLRNLVLASEAGAVILPASPGFYNNPRHIGDLVDMVVARIISQFNLPTDILTPWQGYGQSRE